MNGFRKLFGGTNHGSTSSSTVSSLDQEENLSSEIDVVFSPAHDHPQHLQKHIIIGAGPAGLCTAIQLRKAGIEHIVLYDARAGAYTRPGIYLESVFTRAETSIGEIFWPRKDGHIKDLERELYKQVQKMGIRVEQQTFLDVYRTAESKGVIVASDGQKTHVPADYVYDCTGGARAVIRKLNTRLINPPFVLKTLPNTEPTRHLLAYVHIKAEYVRKIRDQKNATGLKPDSVSPLLFARSMLRLQALGWDGLCLPRCIAQFVSRNKGCLYLQAPKRLAAEDMDAWLQVVLACYSVPENAYSHMNPSRKYQSKPRFTTFWVGNEYLEKAVCCSKLFPNIIALGDAQIDSNYFIGQGIERGFICISALLESMKIEAGEVSEFDPEHYQEQIEALQKAHKQAMMDHEKNRRIANLEAFEPAKCQIKNAIDSTDDAAEKASFKLLLDAINSMPFSSQPLEEEEGVAAEGLFQAPGL